MTEHSDQVAVLDWCRMMEGQYPELELIYATPNAGKRSYGAARYYKDEGMKSGIPDLFWPCARRGHHGLFIEMKVKNGKVTENQRWWITKLKEQGYMAVVCYGFDHAIEMLTWYLGISDV